MKDTIYRQAAIDAVKCGALSAAMVYGRTDEGSTALYETVKAIKALPSAQPERNTGTWIFVRGEEAGNALYMCSECGKGDIHAPEVKVSYCWNCGAEMTQDREDK